VAVRGKLAHGSLTTIVENIRRISGTWRQYLRPAVDRVGSVWVVACDPAARPFDLRIHDLSDIAASGTIAATLNTPGSRRPPLERNIRQAVYAAVCVSEGRQPRPGILVCFGGRVLVRTSPATHARLTSGRAADAGHVERGQ